MASKMKLKGKKIKLKPKYFIYIIIIYMAFSFSFYFLMKNNKNINNKTFTKLLISGNNYNQIYNFKLTNIINFTVKKVLNIDLTKPSSILTYQITNESKKESDTSLSHEEAYYDVEKLKKISSYIEDPYKIDINNPLIYIYNTHQLENYNNKNLSIYNITPNVLMASYILKEKLNKLGVSTIVEDTNLTDFMYTNGWDYNSSYKATKLLLLDKRARYPSLKYYIDLHRDSVSKDISTTIIDNKSYARILFVIGLEHPDHNENMKTTEKLNDIIKNKYPSLTRGIYEKSGPGVNGIYNQDVNKNVMLLELGAVDNTIEEVYNTLELLTPILKEFVIGDG